MKVLRSIAFVLLVACYAQADPVTNAERLQLADGLYSRGMHELALAEYEAFLKDFPDSKQGDVVLFRLGECCRLLGRKVEAERAFRRVLSDFPASEFRHQAGFRRAGLFLDVGNPEDALTLFDKVLAEKPPTDMAAACLYYCAEALLKLEKPAEAVGRLEKLRTEHPGTDFHSYALLKLGSLYKDEARSLEAYEAVVKAPGSDRVAAEALFQTAEIYFRKGDYEKSAEAYRKLMVSFPTDQRAGEARLQAAWAAHNAGLYAEALRITGEMLKAEPVDDKPNWLYLKANCERQLLRNDDAVASYLRLLQEFPENRFADAARYERALTFYRMGKFAEAVEQALLVVPSQELKKDLYWLLAESYSGLDRPDDAVQYYRLITMEFPDSDIACDATYRLAYQLQQRGELKEAARYFQTVAGKFPDDELAPQALFAAGYCLSEEGLHAEAVRDWSTLIREHPKDSRVAEAFYQKAMGEIRLQRNEDGLSSLRELRRLFPESKHIADAYHWEGMLLKTAGKLQDAEGAFREVLKRKPTAELERETKFHLGMVLYKQKEFDEAADILQSLLDSPMGAKLSPALVEWLSEHQHARARPDDAMAAARFLVDKHEEATWKQSGWCLVGRVHLAAGRMVEAEDAFSRALTLQGKSRFAAEAALRLGDVRYEGHVYEAADSYYARAAALSSDENLLGIRARAYAGLGRTALAMKQDEQAARYFMSVAVLFDDQELVPECLHLAASAFGRSGKKEEQVKALTELRTRYPQSPWAKQAGPGNETP